MKCTICEETVNKSLGQHLSERHSPGNEVPGQPGYVVGTCGHRLAASEWRAGYRNCERCGEYDDEYSEYTDVDGYDRNGAYDGFQVISDADLGL